MTGLADRESWWRRAASRPFPELAGLAALVALAVAFHGDYSLTWDETVDHFRRKAGEKTWNFWFGGFAADEALWDFGHNPSTSFIYYAIWRGLRALSVPISLVDLWHLLTAFVGVAAVAQIYRLGRRLYDRRVGLLAGLTLATWPFWVGDAFGNFKDVPFAAAWLLCVDTALTLVERPSRRAVVHHGLAVTLLLVVRMGGLLFVPLSLAALVLGIRALRSQAGSVDLPESEAPRGRGAPSPNRPQQLLGAALVMVVVALGLHALSYPYVLLNPVSGLVDLVAANRSFVWEGETLTLGVTHPSTATPWWYVPAWFLVKLPELTLLGLGWMALVALRRRFVGARGSGVAPGPEPGAHEGARSRRAFCLATVAWPLGYVLVAGAPIYDGIRHVLFVVPPLIALSSSVFVGHSGALRRGLAAGVVTLGLAAQAVDVVRYHPVQTAWFNHLAGGASGAAPAFTVDYWAATARWSSEWIAAHTAPAHVCVTAEIEESWQYYLPPPWRVTGAQRLEGCPSAARFAYVFARNRFVQDARALAEDSQRWVEIGHLDLAGATLGVWFQRAR